MENNIDVFAKKDTPNSCLRELARQFSKKNEACSKISPRQMEELKEIRKKLSP